VLADLDSNGIFNDPEQSLFHGDRFFVDSSGAAGSDQDSQLSSFAFGEFIRIASSWYALSATPDGAESPWRPPRPGLAA